VATLKQATAGIDLVVGQALPRATLFTNPLTYEEFAIFNLTNGFSFNRDEVKHAFTFFGHVDFSGNANDFVPWSIGFVQLMSHRKLVATYLGQQPSGGAIIVDVGQLIGTAFLLDAAKDAKRPFFSPPSPTDQDGQIVATMGDHPNASLRLQLKNAKTGATNSLFKVEDVRRAVSVFAARDPAGVFHHFAHVVWDLKYEVEFGILDGDVTVRNNRSTFAAKPVVKGAPTEATAPGITAPLQALRGPTANEVAQRALSALSPTSPARRDLDSYPAGAPTDFVFTLPPIRVLPPR
jgi:hypothetical protein